MKLSRRTFMVSATSVAGAAVIRVPAFAQTPAASSEAGSGRRTVFHGARIIAEVPEDLEPQYGSQDLYIGGIGQFVFAYPTAGNSIDEIVQQIAVSAEAEPSSAIDIDLNGVAGKLLESVRSPNLPASASIVIAPYPEPFERSSNQMTHVVIEMAPAYQEVFLPTVSLDIRQVTPEEYLDAVLDLAELNALVTNDVDWEAIRTDAESATADMDAVHEFFDSTIMPALETAGDHHTRFLPPGAIPEPADPFPTSTMLSDGTVVLTIPMIAEGDYAGYVDAAQRVWEEAVASNDSCKGVIVDLRVNRGGNIYVMIAALAPLLPAGDIFGYTYPSMPQPDMWTKERVLEFLEANTGITVSDLDLTHFPVAVLMGPDTASSGELAAIAFIGRHNTRSFGMESAGYTTANNSFALLDGWTMNLAASLMTDRTGASYGETLMPDIEVKFSNDQIGTDDDRVVVSAQNWLERRPCESLDGRPEATLMD